MLSRIDLREICLHTTKCCSSDGYNQVRNAIEQNKRNKEEKRSTSVRSPRSSVVAPDGTCKTIVRSQNYACYSL
jgi:hypothetical protein